MSTEIRQKITEARERLEAMADAVQLEDSEKRLKALEESMNQPGFWDNQEKAQEVIQDTKRIRSAIEPVKELLQSTVDLEELLELAESESDDNAIEEIVQEAEHLGTKVDRVELMTTLSGKHDRNGAFINIHAGAGGTEACDWASMLVRAYMRWGEENNFKVKIIDTLADDEAGYRSATIQVDGTYAYGYLKSEIGVHRLVRISPFDAKNRRHTSFVSVDVLPILPDDIQVEINASDLRVDTYRAGGAGGQHVNKTDSAVRITHVPTGIVVQCQNERSQHSNRASAMKVLQARLVHLEEAKREKELAAMYSEKGEIAWGNQIRSYVLQPYTMVKDNRTAHEEGNANAVLDGKLQPFMEAYLRWKRRESAGQ